MIRRKIRFLTAIKRGDGHDVAIDIVNRVTKNYKDHGIEVIYLGENQSIDNIVNSAIQEDAALIGLSSKNGGHIGFCRELLKLLKAKGANYIDLVIGGGNTINPIKDEQILMGMGVKKVFYPGPLNAAPEFIYTNYHNDILEEELSLDSYAKKIHEGDIKTIAKFITILENKALAEQERQAKWLKLSRDVVITNKIDLDDKLSAELIRIDKYINRVNGCIKQLEPKQGYVTGLTGKGGSGKSTLTDLLAQFYLSDQDNQHKKIAILAVDPTYTKSGGALLGDRIRMSYPDIFDSNILERVFMRSMATRGCPGGIAQAINDSVYVLKSAGYDSIFIETAGIGQGDDAITKIVNTSVFIMTPEYGDQINLIKNTMLYDADIVVMNQMDKLDAKLALTVIKRELHGLNDNIIGTNCTKNMRDKGISLLYQKIKELRH